MPGDLTVVLAAVICAAFVTAAGPVLIALLRWAAIDIPNTRSSHSVPTPSGGRAEQVRRLAEDKAFAIDHAVRDLGYAPRSFADGIGAEARAMGLAA